MEPSGLPGGSSASLKMKHSCLEGHHLLNSPLLRALSRPAPAPVRPTFLYERASVSPGFAPRSAVAGLESLTSSSSLQQSCEEGTVIALELQHGETEAPRGAGGSGGVESLEPIGSLDWGPLSATSYLGDPGLSLPLQKSLLLHLANGDNRF